MLVLYCCFLFCSFRMRDGKMISIQNLISCFNVLFEGVCPVTFRPVDTGTQIQLLYERIPLADTATPHRGHLDKQRYLNTTKCFT
jgi:hypothetical protein